MSGSRPRRDQVHVAGGGEDRDHVDLALQQHLLLQVRRDVEDVDLGVFDVVLLGHQRQELERGAARRRAELLAGQVLERVDRARCLGQQRERRAVVDHVDHQRRVGRLGRRVLDDGVHVAETRVIGARHDARHGRGRAFALVDGDVELLGGKISLLLRPVVPGVDALDLPVERELDPGHILREAGRRGQRKSQRCGRQSKFGEHLTLLLRPARQPVC